MVDEVEENDHLKRRVDELMEIVQDLQERLGKLDKQQPLQVAYARPDEVRVMSLPGQPAQVRLQGVTRTILRSRIRGVPRPEADSWVDLTIDDGPGTKRTLFIIQGRGDEMRRLVDELDKVMRPGNL